MFLIYLYRYSMSKLVTSEKSANNEFQFSLWNNNEQFIIEIKRFFTQKNGKNFSQYDKITFTPESFERFKTWIIKFKQ